jgi:hypothetical protein
LWTHLAQFSGDCPRCVAADPVGRSLVMGLAVSKVLLRNAAHQRVLYAHAHSRGSRGGSRVSRGDAGKRQTTGVRNSTPPAGVLIALRAHSLGLASVSSEQMDRRTLDTVNAGLHWSFKMSRQIWPLLLMLQW